MDNSPLAFASVAEVDAERISLCQMLLKLETGDTDATQREIVDLTTRLVLRRAIRNVDERKVHVDVNGIREAMSAQLREKFERWVANAKLTDERLRQTFQYNARIVGNEVRHGSYGTHDEGLALFVEIFREVHQQFLWSVEHGLNFYLSVRIRHGTLAGQIRRRFEASHLVTTKNKDGVYSINTYWEEQFAPMGEELATRADDLLKSFARDVDGMIERVRGKWIQIKAHPDDTDALFNFDFSPRQLSSLNLTMQFACLFTYDEFLSGLFDALWERTNIELKEVRDRIGGDLKNDFVEMLRRLEDDVLALSPERRHPAFSNAITSCRTAIQNELESIAGWFSVVDKTEVPDFDFSLVVDTGIEIIRGLHPARAFTPVVSIESKIQCEGKLFVPFIDIILILLENVVSHAGEGTVVILVRSMRGPTIVLEVRNPVHPKADVAEVRAKLERLRREAAANTAATAMSVAHEGGSGFLKLCKLLGVLFISYQVHFDIEADNTFVARVAAQSTGGRL